MHHHCLWPYSNLKTPRASVTWYSWNVKKKTPCQTCLTCLAIFPVKDPRYPNVLEEYLLKAYGIWSAHNCNLFKSYNDFIPVPCISILRPSNIAILLSTSLGGTIFIHATCIWSSSPPSFRMSPDTSITASASPKGHACTNRFTWTQLFRFVNWERLHGII